MPATDIDVIVLFGGACAERDVSIRSAREVVRALHACAHTLRLWWWSPGGAICELPEMTAAIEQDGTPEAAGCLHWWPTLQRAVGSVSSGRRASVVFNALHGGAGENGEVARLLEHQALPFTGSGSAACRAAFDKASGRAVAASLDIATAAGLVTGSDFEMDRPRVQELLASAGAVIVKPRREGSSFGVGLARSVDEVAELTGQRADWVVEAFVAGREFTVGVADLADGRGAQALPVVEIMKVGPVFDFEAKYGGRTREVCPAELPARTTQALQTAAVHMHEALKARGYSRSDFIVGNDGVPVFLETNVLPGLTAASLLPLALRAHGVAFEAFLEAQLRLALARPSGCSAPRGAGRSRSGAAAGPE